MKKIMLYALKASTRKLIGIQNAYPNEDLDSLIEINLVIIGEVEEEEKYDEARRKTAENDQRTTTQEGNA